MLKGPPWQRSTSRRRRAARTQDRKYKKLAILMSCISVLGFSRVGRKAANDVDGCA